MYRLYLNRLVIQFILSAFVAACAAPVAGPTPPQLVETEAPLASDTAPPLEPATTTTQSSPTDSDIAEEPPTPTAEPSATPTAEPKGLDDWLAYVDADLNLWIMNPATGESLALTDDALPFQPNVDQETVTYCCAQFSSDGSLLAYRREQGRQTEQAYEYTYSLWVYELDTGESRLVLDELALHYAWKPGEHLIAYGPEISFDYFIGDEQRAQFANGIWALDVDSGETYELVAPERGFALAFPRWSPDGRFLSFDEIQYMEGRGLFAYYDLETQEYIAWDEVIGNYDWSPDGELIAYDTLAYISQGIERIWLRERTGQAREFSPLFDPGSASYPVFSPQGDRIAYLAAIGGPETTRYSLMLQDLDSDEPRDLGQFEGVYELAWTSDGTSLVFAAGPYEAREIVQVLVEDGSAASLAVGAQPALQP
jgi:Tol biopolymer transport system component